MKFREKKKIYKIQVLWKTPIEVELDEYGLIVKIKCLYAGCGVYEWIECSKSIEEQFRYTLEQAQQKVNYLIDVGEIKL